MGMGVLITCQGQAQALRRENQITNKPYYGHYKAKRLQVAAYSDRGDPNVRC